MQIIAYFLDNNFQGYWLLNIAFWLESQKTKKQKNANNAPVKIAIKKNSVVNSELIKNEYI